MHANTFINFNNLLGQIFDLVKMTDAEKKRMLSEYNELVIGEMTNLILAYEEQEKHLFENPEMLQDQLTTDPEAIDASMARLFHSIQNDLSPEAKVQIYLFSKLTIFLQIIEPIIKNGTEEDRTEIGRILTNDKKFLEAYRALESQLPNLKI